jgi:hypothetical protein
MFSFFQNWMRCIVFLCFSASLSAQTLSFTDPISSFNKYSEFGIAVNATRVNTNYTEFQTEKNQYSFLKNNYLRTVDFTFSRGYILKGKNNQLYTVKSGLNLLSRKADLIDTIGDRFRLSTYYFEVPIQIGFRTPLKYNTLKNNFYRAIEGNIGLYLATPFFKTQKLDHPDNLDSKFSSFRDNYFRFGFKGEMMLTALNSLGKGHKIGLRYSQDFTTILKQYNTEYELYPFYINVGVFYVFANKYVVNKK